MQFISSIFQHFHQPNGAKKECPWKHIDEPNAEQTYKPKLKKNRQTSIISRVRF